MTNYTTEDIYFFFRKAQAEQNNRGFRMPKNFEKHLETKMSLKNREALVMLRDYFNTKWCNIDPLRYFKCGFELYKSFTYTMFFKPNIITLYKEKDKILKRETIVNKMKLKDSFGFVKNYMKKNGIRSIADYCRIRDGESSKVSEHYMSNSIDGVFVIFLMRKGLYLPNDYERAIMPYISINYNKVVLDLEEMGLRI